MKKFLIATSNPGKMQMFRDLLKWENFDLVFLSDLGVSIDSPDETGLTVEENALLKARYYGEIFGLPTIGDDAGFEIPALGGVPWVKGRRWAGELPDTVSDDDWLAFFLEKIRHIPGDRIGAAFPFSRCLYFPDGRHFFQTERIDFFVSKTPRIPFKSGWPVSSVCIFPDGRHELDIPQDDPIWQKQRGKEWLIKLLGNL